MLAIQMIDLVAPEARTPLPRLQDLPVDLRLVVESKWHYSCPLHRRWGVISSANVIEAYECARAAGQRRSSCPVLDVCFAAGRTPTIASTSDLNSHSSRRVVSYKNFGLLCADTSDLNPCMH